MKIKIENIKETNYGCDALILPVSEGDYRSIKNLVPPAASVVKKLFAREYRGRLNELLLIPAPDGIKAEKILLVGLGKKKEISRDKLRQAGGKSVSYLRDMGMKKIALSTGIITALKLSPIDFIEGSLLGLYSFDRYRMEKKDTKLNSIAVLARASAELNSGLRWIQHVTSSVCFARDLINTPSNKMTPAELAKAALSLKGRKVTVKVLNRNDVQRLGMEAFLSVARGSHEPPKFIVIKYRGAKNAPLVLIGKSITFDSGGISLKPAEGMEKMKYDMAGGAAVLGIIRAAARAGLRVNLVGILPATENIAGSSPSKPGDVVRAIDGKTIEIINTDAEGRLVLADAIGYAKRFRPEAIIDIATLTGACSIALGNEAVAVMGNDSKLIGRLKKSAEATYERVWEMPLFEEYKEYLKSDIADIKNSGGRNGSLVTSAYFLYEFAGQLPWVHLDIAGTAWTDKDRAYLPKGATGVSTRLILDFLKGLQ